MSDIWTSAAWPNFTYDPAQTEGYLARFSELLGECRGLCASLGEEDRALFSGKDRTEREEGFSTLLEGEPVSKGRIVPNISPTALAEVLSESQTARAPIDEIQLKDWHRKLFASSDIGGAGNWRAFEMVIAEQNYQPVPVEFIAGDMTDFFFWLNGPSEIPNPIRAGLALLWFESIHPFSEGNAALGSLIADRLLTGAGSVQFNTARELLRDRPKYHEALSAGRKEGRGGIDATEFVIWFLDALSQSLEGRRSRARYAVDSNHFFRRASGRLSERQGRGLRALFALGAQAASEGLTARIYAGLAQTSSATATRDLSALVTKGILVAGESGGRSVRYFIAQV